MFIIYYYLFIEIIASSNYFLLIFFFVNRMNLKWPQMKRTVWHRTRSSRSWRTTSPSTAHETSTDSTLKIALPNTAAESGCPPPASARARGTRTLTHTYFYRPWKHSWSLLHCCFFQARIWEYEMGKRINFSAVFDDVHVFWVKLHVFFASIYMSSPSGTFLFHSESFSTNHSWLCFPFSLDTLIREQVVRNTVIKLIIELAGLDCRVRCW